MAFSLDKIFSLRNRGILLDFGVFAAGGLMMGGLSFRLNALTQRAKGGDLQAQIIMVLYVSAVCILPGVGAAVKYLFGKHRAPSEYREQWSGKFLPLMKFALFGQFIAFAIFLLANSFMRNEMGPNPDANHTLAGLLEFLFVLSFVFALADLVFVYLYFSVADPAVALRSGTRSIINAFGDLVILLNMLLYQAFWGVLMADLTRDYTGVFERLFMLFFTAMVIYLPPRLFFLAEDGHRPITWAFILLANLPLILRIFFS
jgi:hypothetical protein